MASEIDNRNEFTIGWHGLLYLRECVMEWGDSQTRANADLLTCGLKGNSKTRFRVVIEELPAPDNKEVTPSEK